MKILNFNYQDKTYEISKNRSKLYFLVNDKEATIEEKKVFYIVLQQLIPRKLRYVNKLPLQGIEYKLFKDNNKNIYYFEPFNPSLLSDFNKLFNNQNDYVAIGEHENDYFQRIVKIGKKITLVAMSALVALSAKSSSVLNQNIDEESIEIVSIVDVQEELAKDLKNHNVDIDKLTPEIIVEEEIIIESADSSIDEFKEDDEELSTALDDLIADLDTDNLYTDRIPTNPFEEDLNESQKTIDPVTGEEFYDLGDGAGVYISTNQDKEQTINNAIPTNPFEEMLDEATKIVDPLTGEITYDLGNGAGATINPKEQNKDEVKQRFFEAVAKNPNLTQEEKEWVLKMESMLLDNLERINLDDYLEKISAVSMYYEKEKKDYIAGEYYLSENYIVFYDVEDISEVEPSVITHELSHMLQYTFNNFVHGILTESANVLFNNEYVSNNASPLYDSAYYRYANYLKAIIEIIGPEYVRNFNFTTDYNFFKIGLNEIIPDETKSDALIDNIEYYYICEHTGIVPLQEEYDSQLYEAEFLGNLRQEIVGSIKDYYEQKYNLPMESDIVMQYYTSDFAFDFDILNSLSPTYTKVVELENHYQTNLNKSYFNSSTINDEYNYYTCVTVDGIAYNCQATINEQNRYLPLIPTNPFEEDLNESQKIIDPVTGEEYYDLGDGAGLIISDNSEENIDDIDDNYTR